MRAHLFPLQNRGMSRDMSVSKADNAMAWDNHNIRVTARDKDTLLSITNERGTAAITLPEGTLQGELIGWNVLNKHILLFTTTSEADAYLDPDYKGSGTAPDYIYRIDYDGDGFEMANGEPLFTGWLGFDVKHPIESIVYFETDNIQKIYWIDGIHVLRFMNFMADATERARWQGDDTYFDSNREASLDVTVSITKDWSGNNRPNGTAQYFLTYFNKHGQETGRVWTSDLVYLSPKDKGGSQDGTNSCNVVFNFSHLSTGFDHVRLYSLVRTSIDGQPVAYLVAEAAIEGDSDNRRVTVVDSGAYLSAVDPTELLYLGSRAVVANTMTHKDQTLFLGGLSSVDRSSYESLSGKINETCFVDDNGDVAVRTSTNNIWRSGVITFRLSNDTESIPYPECTGLYPYESQLSLSSSGISTFKGGELYRFALTFIKGDGTSSDAFWIGDKINPLYPKIEDNEIRRPLAVCSIPSSVVAEAVTSGYVSVTLMIAKATYSDRSVKAQGIVNPTMFNLWDRYNDRLFSYSSWINRPRGSGFANHHFEVVHNSNVPDGEIQCNYWENDTPTPWYRKYTASGFDKTGGTSVQVSAGDIVDTFDGLADYDCFCVAYRIKLVKKGLVFNSCSGTYVIMTAKFKNGGTLTDLPAWDNLKQFKDYSGEKYEIKSYERYFSSRNTGKPSIKSLYTRMYNSITTEFNIPIAYVPTYTMIDNWYDKASKDGTWFNINDSTTKYSSWWAALSRNNVPDVTTWYTSVATVSSADADYLASYYRKHLFFVDENVVTLNSPEIELEAVSIDSAELSFRIIGAAKITGNISDYVIETGPSKMAGLNIFQKSFSHANPSDEVDGLTSWPLYLEQGLMQKDDVPEKVEDRDSSHYQWGGGIQRYWMYMWHKSGLITGFQDEEEETRFSELHYKTFANLRFAYSTAFNDYGSQHNVVFESDTAYIRQYTALDNQYTAIKADGSTKMYDANIDTGISMPGVLRYPLFYSPAGGADTDDAEISGYDLTSSEPITLSYRSTAHAVISLGRTEGIDNILPWLNQSDRFEDVNPVSSSQLDNLSPARSAGFLPWRAEAIPEGALYYGGRQEMDSVDASTPANTVFLTSNVSASSTNAIIDRWRSIASSSPDRKVYSLVTVGGTNYLADVTNARLVERFTPSTVHIDVTFTSPSVTVTFNCPTSFDMYGLQIQMSGQYQDAFSGGDWMSLTGDNHSETAPQDSQSYTYSYTFPEIESWEGEISYEAEISVLVSWWDDSADVGSYSADSYHGMSGTLMTDGSTVSIALINDVTEYDFKIVSENPVTTGSFSIYNQSNMTYGTLDVATGAITGTSSVRAIAKAHQERFMLDSGGIEEGDKYMLVGEVYLDPESSTARERFYNGISDAAIESNTFIPASANVMLDADTPVSIVGDRGDTFFQRWDFLKTRPTSTQAENGVVDIVSAMVESHINLDGRYDNMRGTSVLASINVQDFNSVNPVYTQPDDFIAASDLDDDFNLDTYDSSLTWTLPKADSADVDAWTHITLASSLALDGDKGKCRALRRFQNSILAFQDRGIAEVLFNSRTQLATQEGVPIEVANSGKVDGKHYISNKYGCLNKWSIIEGKSGLYFIDNINKMLGVFNGQGIDSLSSKSMFDAWIRERNSLSLWNPDDFGNFVAYYDKIHSDVYFISDAETDPCIVYNEQIGAFTSFFDYARVPMMTNVEDRFVSFYNHRLWKQNEGEYNDFFGSYKPYWMTWRVQPDPYGDKIWTNLEYRADFFSAPSGEALDFSDSYMPNKTFTSVRVWNEYQDTGDYAVIPNMDYRSLLYPDAQKRFRIWRTDIARDSNSAYSLDRIRNPWIFLKLTSNVTEDTSLMQLHDVNVKYFTNE